MVNRLGWQRNWWLTVVLVAVGLCAAATNAATLPAGFSTVAVVRPDGRAWEQAEGLVSAPDGRLFIWERSGRVWIVGGRLASTAPALDLSDEVSTIGDLGLKGLALDPQFEANGYVYVSYAVEPLALWLCTAPAAGAGSCSSSYRAGTHATSGATIGRLVRYTFTRAAGARDFSDATRIDPATRRVLIGATSSHESTPPQGCLVTDAGHGPGAIVFGNDGTLLVACGDGASATADDAGSLPETQFREALNRGLMTRTENVGAFRAQLVNSLSGKILRIDPATGDGAASNPFFDPIEPRAARSRVWALGLHDPQRFTVRVGSGSTVAADGEPGTLYIGDLGYLSWEALDVTASAATNFGWPLYEGAGNEKTRYSRLAVFNLDAPTDVSRRTCTQPYYRFSDLLQDDAEHTAEWTAPCIAQSKAPLALDTFLRSRPAIDWLHNGLNARWAAVDSSGHAVALTLGTAAPNGATVTGSMFGGTSSIGGVWYRGTDFPTAFRNVYFHADGGGQWVKAVSVDANDNPLAVRDFLSNGGAVRALGTNLLHGGLYFISGPTGADVRQIVYNASAAAVAAAAASRVDAATVSTARSPAVASGSATPSTTRTATTAALGASARSRAAQTATGSRAAVSHLSAPASSSPLPLPWTAQDVGAVAVAGSSSASGSVFTVSGSGADIWYGADAFQFASQPFTGNGTITARVVSQTNSNVWAKAGVMFRETLAAGANFASVLVTPGNGTVYQARATTNGGAVSNQLSNSVTLPYWVRVTRAGTTFSGYTSTDGVTWTLGGTYTISMASQLYVGLAVTSHADGTMSTVVFDNITVTTTTSAPAAPTVPTGLTTTAVTAASVGLSWTASTNSSPSGVGGYYIYRNGNTTTPLATVTSGTSYLDTAVAASTAYTYRVAAFDTTTPSPNVSAASSPALSVTTPAAGGGGSLPLTGADIGVVAAAGSSSANGGVYTVNGSGADIWYGADAFQFDSEPFAGNGTITARVVSQTNSNVWAKAGVMFRESLSAGATFASVLVTPGNGTVYQARTTTNGSDVSNQVSNSVTLPYWVRVTRAGTTFTGYTSPDGVIWTASGTYTISMASQVYVGLAVTSHQDGTLSTAVFDNVTVTATSSIPTAPTVPTNLTATGVSASSLTLNWTASIGRPPGPTRFPWRRRCMWASPSRVTRTERSARAYSIASPSRRPVAYRQRRRYQPISPQPVSVPRA